MRRIFLNEKHGNMFVSHERRWSCQVQVVGVVPGRTPSRGNANSGNSRTPLQAEARAYGPHQQRPQQGERRGDAAGGGVTDTKADGGETMLLAT